NPRPGYLGTFLFENNLCVNNGKNGINFDRSNYSSAIIRNNTIYFNGVHEIIQNISVIEGNPRHGGQKVAGIIANFVYNVTVANNIVVTRNSDYSALKLNNVDDPFTVDDPNTDDVVENANDGTKIATNNIFLNGTVAYPGNQVPANQINVDPLFVDAPTLNDDATTITGWTGYLDGTDFSLQQNSPAINAGSSDYSPALDINKNPRPVIPENVISSTSFELDNGGWANFGSSVTNSSETAKTGSTSLKTISRTKNFHSPRIFLNNLLTVGETYTFYVWVKLAEGSGLVQLTVKSTVNGVTTAENADTYTNLASATASANDWVLLTDNYTHTQNDQSFLYVKGPDVVNNIGVDYYIDNFSLVNIGENEVDFTTVGDVVDIGAYEYQPQPLSLSDNPSQATAVYAYPNPSKDMLTLINVTDEESVAVYDVLGRKLAIQQQRNANSLKLNVSKLDTGIYFIHVFNTKGETKSIRFIKK
ncbi:MAG: T9SS type A sorting domain-containing protein, partial [Bacteroidetes bacterium]|nr:T9SS type A sorting domain-containing protein [Bacteroidota bacterium]